MAEKYITEAIYGSLCRNESNFNAVCYNIKQKKKLNHEDGRLTAAAPIRCGSFFLFKKRMFQDFRVYLKIVCVICDSDEV